MIFLKSYGTGYSMIEKRYIKNYSLCRYVLLEKVKTYLQE